MEFIEKLKEEIRKKGITKTELARITNISEGSIRSWEKGSQPTMDKLIKISQYLNISLDELCCNELKKNDSKLLKAYNEADEGTKAAVNKLLDINEETEDEEQIEKSLSSKIG